MMATYSTTICTDDDDAPQVTERVCTCQACGWRWVSRGPASEEGCPECGCPATAVTVVSEAADYGGVVVR